MKRMLALLAVGLLVLSASWSVAIADDDDDNDVKSDFALFDGTNPENQPNEGAICGAGNPSKLRVGKAYTYHVTVSNYGSAGEVRITYHDGDVVDYLIGAGATLQISQGAGNSGGADRAVRVSRGDFGAPQLVGSMSAIGEKVFCISCGGANEAACDALILNLP